MRHTADKWHGTHRHPDRIPTYRPQKPFRFTDWAAL